MRLLTSFLFCLVALSLVATTATAEIGNTLGEIEWGDNPQQVLEKLRTAKLAELREDHTLRANPAQMQRARQGVLDQMRRVEDSHTDLRGERTDYDMSIIATEFTKNNNESVLRVRDNVAQHFYFFIDNELYKLVIAYNQDQVQHLGFQAFVDRVTQRYGAPVSTERGTIRGEEGMVEATWMDTHNTLRVNNRRQFFGTFTMAFSDRQFEERWTERGRVFGGNDQEEEAYQVSDRVRQLTAPSDHRRGSALDSMVGEITVDLSTGDEDEEDEAEESTSASAGSQPAAQEQPASRPRQRQRRQQPQEDDDDDLVIY